MFGRGGPAAGAGLGWCLSGGGFWSTVVLLAQTDPQFLIDLLEIIHIVPVSELLTDDEIDFAVHIVHSALGICLSAGPIDFAVHIVHSALGICLSAGPRDKVIVDKAFDILLQVTVLKSLDLFALRYIQTKEKMQLFGWEFKEVEYLHFSKTLTSHFKSRWLGIKRKSKAVYGNSSSGNRTFKRGSASLDAIPEELDPIKYYRSRSLLLFFGSGVGSLEIPSHELVSQSNLNHL